MDTLSQDEIGWIILYECKFPASLTYNIYKNISKGADIINYKDNIELWKKLLGDEKFEYFECKCSLDTVDMFKIQNLKKGINFITLASNDYPDKLKEIDNPPLVLFYIGDISLLKTTCVSIVGTRLASSYGANVTQKFAKTLAESGITIVSGLAEGVDTFAHMGALEAKGKTIAVLAGGLSSIYPATNTNLAKEIAKNGLLITEYSYGEGFLKYHFPYRNRIIAGLSEGVLITEASSKSGTRHTIEYAIEMNRNIYAIPGNITSYKSEYPNRLIKSCNACMVMSPEDILSDLNCTYIPKVDKEIKQMDLTESNILAILKEEQQVHFDEILAKTELETRRLNSILINMELMGLIVKLPGNNYSLK